MQIGLSLVKNGLISLEQLDLILAEQQKTQERIGDIAIRLGFVNPHQLAPFIAEHFSLPFVELKKNYKAIKPEIISLIPEDLAYRFVVIPLEMENNALVLAVADPLNIVADDTLKLKTGLKIKHKVASAEDIIEAIDYCYHQLPRLKEHINHFIELEPQSAVEKDFEKLRIEANDPPVVKYVHHLIVQAVNSDASDIHIQPKQDKVRLCFRVDGILYDFDPPPKSMLAGIITRIKILAGLDIAERRLPQDGRFKMVVGAVEIDVRTSCFPTIYGENIVMRILNTSSPLLGLEQLGFSQEDVVKFRELIHRPYGLILVTGPTGSGKTTTLYTALNEIKSSDKNMITLEDPVEYRLPFIQQSQMNSVIGFDFARGLRSVLRQDPDVIMVGEIRDKETAEIAIHASLTGHLVFSTLHTNDATGATVRLINMGVEPFLITSSLIGVLAQRLIRSICHNCRKEYLVNEESLERLSLDEKLHKFFKGQGCSNCLNSGYRGRSAIFELLTVNDAVRSLILKRSSSEEIKRQAQADGMKTLRESGIEKIKMGITTVSEVLRVTQEAESI
ncbi:MAG: Flp pilus assembly complex ATPase component TadA [Candidatus Omnitrophica bacterium]|nr:Flp pilus assembly complex ATPase component TadA [Candidatus Omnitrophota bacterium]